VIGTRADSVGCDNGVINGEWFARWLAARKPYLEESSYRDYAVNGRLRLVPRFGEIAQSLFVTEKTVETHLGRAFREARHLLATAALGGARARATPSSRGAGVNGSRAEVRNA
jgi:hypothetical protein